MWSPRELGELAGTSRRTVRYYDEIGLLPAPDRGVNGYSRYGVDHLVRLLRIRRLTELGLSLPQISTVGDASRPPDDMIRGLDAQLADQAERIQQARADLAAMLSQPETVDVALGLGQQVHDIPDFERSLVVVLSRLLSPQALSAYIDFLVPYRDSPTVRAFEALPADAEPSVRAAMAQRLGDHLTEAQRAHPEESAIVSHELRRGTPPRQRIVDDAIAQLYNPAQRDVLSRLRVLHKRARDEPVRVSPRRRRGLVDSH